MLQVGSVPRGLPGLSVNYDFSSASQLLPTAALICGVAILVGATYSHAFSTFESCYFTDAWVSNLLLIGVRRNQ